MEGKKITVRVEPDFDWSSCVIRIDFREINPQIIEGIENIINLWFEVGSLGGYRDVDRAYTSVKSIEMPSDTAELEYLGKFNWTRDSLEFFVDLGTAGDVAIDTLLNLFIGFNSRNLSPIRRVWIGYPGEQAEEEE